MSSATGPGKWQLAGIFLVITAPMLLANWWLGVRLRWLSENAADIIAALIPILGAALTGAWWRGRLPAYPDWPTRRPYSQRMAVLLFLADSLSGAVIILALIWTEPEIPQAEAMSLLAEQFSLLLSAETLLMILPATIVAFLFCLIQTELGLFLGVRLAERQRRGSADGR